MKTAIKFYPSYFWTRFNYTIFNYTVVQPKIIPFIHPSSIIVLVLDLLNMCGTKNTATYYFY